MRNILQTITNRSLFVHRQRDNQTKPNKKMTRTKTTTTKLDLPREIEIQTAEIWLASGAIKVSHVGNENTYYVNEFDHQFMCKNYPNSSH